MSDVPQIYLASPQYGQPDDHSLLARFSGCDPDAPEADQVEVAFRRASSSSLLPKTFNTLLFEAMDMRDAGDITHFCMCHDDIWPDNGWITTLWHEMHTHAADLVSVVVPIKDAPWYRTSTAVFDVADPWRVKRYVEAEHRAELPTTFGFDEACIPGEELVVNTGCWIADLRHDWWDAFVDEGGFNFLTRTTRGEDGRRLTWIQPEDWLMSRFLNRRGAKLMATYAVRLRHKGWAWWSNYDDPISMPAARVQRAVTETETQD